ncbi:MAG: septum formation initiator family protein [bacterium]|nr:septum formation initiator family protein [bacterium]
MVGGRSAERPSGGRVIALPAGRPRAIPRSSRLRLNLPRVALLVAAVYLAVLVGSKVSLLVSLRLDLHRTRQRTQQVESLNAALRDQIADASTDAYVEQAARQLGLTRPGEILFSTSPDRRPPAD